MSAIAIPFLRKVEGTWTFTWETQLQNLKTWKQQASRNFGIPIRKEFKGSKLLSGRGRFVKGKRQLRRVEARDAYESILEGLGVLPGRSIITVTGTKESRLYQHSRLEALLYALLQRMRTACARNRRAGMIFFDEGHGEYRTALPEGPGVSTHWVHVWCLVFGEALQKSAARQLHQRRKPQGFPLLTVHPSRGYGGLFCLPEDQGRARISPCVAECLVFWNSLRCDTYRGLEYRCEQERSTGDRPPLKYEAPDVAVRRWAVALRRSQCLRSPRADQGYPVQPSKSTRRPSLL